MKKIQLIYASKATEKFTEEQFRKIGESAVRHNMHSNVTGLLCFGNDRFLQVLEGERDAVNKTYHRIAADARHKDLCLILVEPIEERSYEGWAMQRVLVDDKPGRPIHQIVLQYAQEEIFEPQEYSADEARHFLEDVRDYIRAPRGSD